MLGGQTGPSNSFNKAKADMAFGGEKENDLTNEQPAEGGATGQVE